MIDPIREANIGRPGIDADDQGDPFGKDPRQIDHAKLRAAGPPAPLPRGPEAGRSRSRPRCEWAISGPPLQRGAKAAACQANAAKPVLLLGASR